MRHLGRGGTVQELSFRCEGKFLQSKKKKKIVEKEKRKKKKEKNQPLIKI